MSDEPDGAEKIVSRALVAQAGLGAAAAIFAFVTYGRFAAQSVALGAGFAALHLYSVARSVRSTYGGGEVTPRARFFVVLRSLRFMSVLAGAALVLMTGLASGVGFLAGYALLVLAIAAAPFLPGARPGRNS